MKDQIYKYIEKYGPVRPMSILVDINISETHLHKNLNKLVDDDLVSKSGSHNAVYYFINKSLDSKNNNFNKIQPLQNLSEYDEYLIERNYIYVSAIGQIIRGIKGFVYWCQHTHLNISEEAIKYIKLIRDVNKIKKFGLISAKKNILSQNKNINLDKDDTTVYLDKLYYSEFYNIGHFGKTRLGQLVYVAKTSQNKSLIKEIAQSIAQQISHIISAHDINYVGFIPPTIDRSTQFIKELELELYKILNLKQIVTKIKIEKIKSETLIAQKTLRKLEDRIYNARHTIVLDTRQTLNGNVLIIDDATGSGATLNETAQKLKVIMKKSQSKNLKNINHKVIGYSIVGSMKGFDVINEI